MRPLMLLALASFLAAGQDEELKEFTHKELNFRLHYPGRFRKVSPPREEIQLALADGTSVIMVAASETNASLEGIVDDIHEDQKILLEALEVKRQEETSVGGERAILIHKSFKSSGVKGDMRIVVFTHQGIAYRLIGVQTGGGIAEFDEDILTCLDHFVYLEERKAWKEKFEGRPVRTALLGGLGAFELRRPRWHETTLDGEREYGALDRVSFKFISDGAWIEFRVHESTAGLDGATEDLRHRLSSRLEKPKSEELAVKIATGEARAFELSGESGGIQRHFRAVVILRDGIRIEAWMEYLHSLREVVKSDWASMTGSLGLQSRLAPSEPPAFPIRLDPSEATPDPGVAAALSGAVRIFEEQRGQVFGVSPDGTTALVAADGIVYRQTLPNGRRQKLELQPAPSGNVAWSRDGRHVAYIAGDQVIVAQLDPATVTKVPFAADAVEFGAVAGELLVCTRRMPTSQAERAGPNRLQLVSLSGEVKKTLVDFPFCRISHPALSPDTRQVAFVCNRDGSRHLESTGHLYVAGADGSGIRQLTREPEEIASVAWSADGKSIHVLRRISVGKDGDVGLGGSNDLHRISVENGAAANLTRSGNVEAAWIAGDDLLVKYSRWGLPPTQRGIYRTGLANLEKATSSRPVPPVVDRLRWSREGADRILKAVGGAKPLRDVVPTAPLLESAARAFAEFAAERCGLALDFSAKSLDLLWEAGFLLDIPSGRHPVLRLGLAAYYGETLRRSAGAEWVLGSAPLGDWSPSAGVEGTPLVEAVLPFSEALAAGFDSESVGFKTARVVTQRDEGRKILLIYPPADGDEAVRRVTGPDYYEAMNLAGKGEAKAAVDLLVKVMLKAPKNRDLAVHVISLCEAGGLASEAASLAERAIAGGIEVPEILMRHADGMLEAVPQKALPFYRKAVEGSWPPAEAYVKLGKAYAALGKKDLAESCWRRGFDRAYRDEVKAEIRQLMGLAPAAGGEE